jgi:FKBP-type peptidyl-prolyl cis-trans isomerase FklB
MRHALVVMLSLGVLLIAAFTGEEASLEQEDQVLGYSIGYQVGEDFKRQGLNLNPEMVVRGVLDALAGAVPLMTEEEMEKTLVRLQSEAQAAQEATAP